MMDIVLMAAVEQIAENVNFSYELMIMIVTLLACLIFIAAELRLGIVMMFLLSGVELIIFNSLGMNIAMPILLLFTSIVLMALSLFVGYSKVRPFI